MKTIIFEEQAIFYFLYKVIGQGKIYINWAKKIKELNKLEKFHMLGIHSQCFALC
jgi:hypothetical protein